jgi:quercetin dioxygenase-like cupin family protein
MKVVNIKNTKVKKNGAPLFTGEVEIQMPISEKDGADLSVGYVHFPKDVANKFHKHSNDQILIVVKGKGFFKTKKKSFELKVGDVAWSPAGEVHAHGATKNSKFTHITVTRAKTKLTQVEK